MSCHIHWNTLQSGTVGWNQIERLGPYYPCTGKMKITILCVIVLLFLGVAHLQSVEFGKNSEEGFRFRHGPMVKHSVHIKNIQQVSAPVGYEIGADLKEEPASPDSLAYNDNSGSSSTTSVQLTLGSDKNRLCTEYGTNFQFLGEVKNNLD